MTVNEIFECISAHLVEGMILHDAMANYYDFLGLHGFKRLHEYHFMAEAAEMRSVNRYFINHYNMLLNRKPATAQFEAPSGWYGHARKDVSPNSKRSAIKTGFDSWVEWEKETKKKYEEYYCDLCELKEIAAASKVRSLIDSVDMELKYAERLSIKLMSVDYDTPTIYMMQDELHDKYAEKECEIGVNIC